MEVMNIRQVSFKFSYRVGSKSFLLFFVISYFLTQIF